MKTKFLGIIILLVLMLVGLSGALIKQRSQTRQYKQNYDAALINHANEQVLTRKEFRRYQTELDELTRQLKIKPKRITQIVEVSHTIIDTVVYSQVVYADTSGRHPFSISGKCYRLDGWYHSDTITKTNYLSTDTLDVILHQAPRKTILWGLIKIGRVATATAYSKCSGDTVAVIKNIRIK